MKRRKEIVADLRKLLTEAEEIAAEFMAKDPHSQERDRKIYKLGALEKGVELLIAELEREDNARAASGRRGELDRGRR